MRMPHGCRSNVSAFGRGAVRQRGALLMEMLAVLVPTTVLAAGAIGFFSLQNRTQVQQDMAVALEENLRAAMTVVTDKLRVAGCGAPSWSLDEWIPWVDGFGDDPVFIQTGPYGDELTVAACTGRPVATITAVADAGDTVFQATSNYPGLAVSELFNATNKSLILIGDRQHARVKGLTGGYVAIDTDPTEMWSQGLSRSQLPGTPITRVDVVTFRVAADASGRPGLEVLKNGESTAARTAENVTELQVIPIDPPRQYQIVLTGQSEQVDPLSGKLLTRSLASDVHLRN